MAGYEIVFRKSVLKDLRKIPPADARLIMQTIESLRENPRPPQSQKLTSREQYRLRRGRYRILYEIQDIRLTIIVVKVAHRKTAY